MLRQELAALKDANFDLEILGFDDLVLARQLNDHEAAGITDEDEVPAVPITSVTRPADLWHRAKPLNTTRTGWMPPFRCDPAHHGRAFSVAHGDVGRSACPIMQQNISGWNCLDPLFQAVRELVAERLGHSSIRTTVDVYAHALRGQDDDAVRRWDEFQRRGTPDTPETKVQ
jgi:hypothetical protein